MATPHFPHRRAADDSGATAVEYGLMIAAITAVIVAAVLRLGNTAGLIFSALDQGWPG